MSPEFAGTAVVNAVGLRCDRAPPRVFEPCVPSLAVCQATQDVAQGDEAHGSRP